MFNAKFVIVFIGIPLGLFLIIFGGRGVAQELNMRSQGQTIEATITDTRSSEQYGYEVQYQFAVNGATYSHADSTGRENLWTPISGQKTDKLSVTYLPSDPWVNRPVDAESNPMEGNLAGLIIGLIAFPMGTIIAISDYRKSKGSMDSDNPLIAFSNWTKNIIAEKTAPKKPCPYCREKIRVDAYVCEHCGRDMPTS